jgi:phosphinothricin acetyltransferase
MDCTITEMSEADWEDVRSIYLEGIVTGQATLETEAPSWQKWDGAHLKAGRLVARNDGEKIAGWAALSPISSRAAYAGVAEISVYVREKYRGRGIGSILLAALIEAAEQNGIWTLQAGIFAENAASIRLHKKHGFREVGRRERIGKLNGVWRDVILLERRSRTVGTD